MTIDRTQQQTANELKSARDLSLKPKAPPARIPGYAIESLLGSGAYGEVWMALDQRTGRRVAVKFYTRQGSVELSLLSREVEKLVFLSADRYVVQLLDVGWDAQPPYYVMDYIENGSLEDELQRRATFPVNEAVELIEEIGIGLMHLHGKGILHCDLKPGNVLLDQDHKPRLADFGQSRLSHELAPALGTLFFMAPEQADLRAAPDARWDVYALGALLYCLLTGDPPFRDAEMIRKIESPDVLEDRLEQYRQLIESAPRPTGHRRVRGVDRALAEIIDRAISRNPRQRFSSVQSMVQALRIREQAHARRPLMILGLIGPLLLLGVLSVFAWNAWRGAIAQTEQSITRQTLETSHWIAQVAARSASEQIDHYYRVLGDFANDPDLQAHLAEVVDSKPVRKMLDQLSNPADNSNKLLEPERNRLIADPLRKTLQAPLERNLMNPDFPAAASWFLCDYTGTQVASAFTTENPSNTIGKNFSFRSYFSGRTESETVGTAAGEAYDVGEDPLQRTHIRGPHLSDIFQSKATNTWKVAFSAPVIHNGRFVGIAAVTADLGSLIEFENANDQYVMLVDARPGEYQGIVLEHPLLREKMNLVSKGGPPLPASLSTRRVEADVIRRIENNNSDLEHFHDPIGDDPEGRQYNKAWIASWADVFSKSAERGQNDRRVVTGLKVIAVADRETAMQPSRTLGQQLARMGTLALLVFLAVSGGLLSWVFRSLRQGRERATRMTPSASDSTAPSVHEAQTVIARHPETPPP
jgi:hypothetical protein